jgi:hypothetical protein
MDTMARLDDIEVPDLLMNSEEMSRSLKIGVKYLRKLEKRGLPYFTLADGNPKMHRYDPIEVWKWFRANVNHYGGNNG